MSGGFKRSGREANPKLTMGLIFGVIAVFFVILFALQHSDLERVAGGDSSATERAAAEGGRTVDNPTTMAEQDLWAALAAKPIDAAAIRARSQMWDAGRRSLRLGMLITLMIFLTVPSIYLFESFVPLLIGGPLILLAAVWGSVRAIAPGGEISKGFDRMDEAMRPLGLSVVRRPKVTFETREPSMPGFSARLSGPTVLDGERHGRTVSVQIGGHEDAGVSEVIVVTRRGGGQSDWLCDLWLAERLAQQF